MGRVVVVGSINDDLLVTATRLPGPGETVAGTGVAHAAGGKGANQAVAAARAGAATAMVGCVGDDEPGRRLVAELTAAGVDAGGVGTVDAPTGIAVVTVADGENTIVVVPGANAALTAAAVEAVPLAAGDVVVAQLETPLVATAAAFDRARAAGAATVLNPAPAAPVPPDVLARVDHLVVNEHEVELVLGVAAADLVADRGDARARLADATTAVVHLTLGADGVLVLVAGAAEGRAGAAHDGTGGLALPAHPVAVVDTTGAGDCFVGTLAAGLAAGRPLAEVVARANAAAALSTTRPGATPSMPTVAEVDALLGRSPAAGR